jgi:hypothetical protein
MCDRVDPFKVQREAAERAVLKKKRKEFLRRQELKVLFRLMFKWQKVHVLMFAFGRLSPTIVVASSRVVVNVFWVV